MNQVTSNQGEGQAGLHEQQVAANPHLLKIGECLKKGERIGGARFRDAVNVRTTKANEYETLTTCNALVGGVAHKAHWRMYLMGPFLYVWHAKAEKVVRVPLSNVSFLEEYDPGTTP